MDGANNDSDQSLTWEDFFGSTTDLTPTLIGIYDSLLEPPLQPVDPSTFPATKEVKHPTKRDEVKRKMAPPISNSPSKDPRLIAGGVKLPGLSKVESSKETTQPQNVNKETANTKMSYVSRFKSFALRKNNTNELQDEAVQYEEVISSNSGASKAQPQLRLGEKVIEKDASVAESDSDRVKVISKLNSEVIAKVESSRKHWLEKSVNSSNSFDNLSPNVKRMLNSAGGDSPVPKSSIVQPKKSGLATVGRSSYRSRQSNIPLMGATSKITQSGVEIVSTADYDRPSELTASLTRINVRSNLPTTPGSSSNGSFVSPIKSSLMNRVTNEWSSATNVSSFSPEKKQKKSASSDVEDIYDIPLNSSAIYDVPKSNKKATINIETKPSEEVQNTTKRKLMDVDVNDSKDSDDFVLLESPKKFNDNFVIIDSPEKMAKPVIIEEEIKVTHDKISPSKPAALNIALALRSLGDTPDQKPKDFENSRNPGVVAQHPNTSMLYSQGSGSVANLKTQSNDERLNNLTNVTNVARPLSMSSIASSSSTSSSGAQNKGVNSAYLASIESLDDHSDVDNSVSFAKNARLAQAAEAKMARDSKDGGINEGGITLARASTPPRPRYCDPSMSLLQRVCTEIVDTEGIYVEDLRQVVEGYLYLWRECGTFSPDDLDLLFSNIEEIYHFNRTFSEQLQRCHLEPGSIARCFVLHSDGFRIYSRYCTGYPDTMAALARLAGERGAALRARQAALGHPLPLGSYLLKPVQRILKYHLLLQNLVKQCMSHDTEYALCKMTGIAQHINDMKKRHEHTVRVQEIQSLLYGWHEQDLTTYGELCAEGTFRVFGAKAMRHAFLFDKMLLLTKNKEYGILAYKSHIMCNNLMLVESIQGQPLSFHVIPFDCPRMQVTLQARNIQHKREWTLLLKRVILENYNAVIPSHARQLVMELGQNKTDDDILAEKSSTLISHSSMKKQLSAPEYLEKRKLERERRKSFEMGLRHRLKRSQRKGQNPDEASGNNESEKDKHIRTDSAYDDDICDCHNNSCSNVDCSNYELCKDCQNQRLNGYLCSNCRSNSVYLCKSCQAERSNYSDSNYDCDEFETTKCRRCDEFQSQSSLDVASDKKLKCSECNNSFNYTDEQGSRENIRVCIKCERHDSFKCSTEEVSKKSNFERCSGCNGKGVKNSCNDFSKKQFDMLDLAEDRLKNRESINLKKTCLKCQEIRENIIVEDNLNYSSDAVGQSFKCEHELADLKAKRGSKDDSQTLLNAPKSNTGTLRRKSEPGMSNINFDPKDWKKSVEMSKCAKSQEELTKDEKSFEGRCADCGRINVTCSNCGRATSIRLNFTCKHSKRSVEIDVLKTGVERKCRSLDREANPLNKKLDINNSTKPNMLEVKMYNSKTVPKKISKIKKNRAKTLRHLAVDSTAKFYTDFATDNVLHISESTDSINTLNSHKNEGEMNADKDQREINKVGAGIPGGEAEDEVYRSLIQKTDSFKQSEIDKDKTLVKKDVNEPLETFSSKIKTAAKSGSASPKSKKSDIEDDAFESCDDGHEKPLEQIISQLLMQNREFQKILKRHQLRNATNRRHQRLLKSHSNPEKVLMQARESQAKVRPKYGRQTSAVESLLHNIPPLDISDSEKVEIAVEPKDNCTLPSIECIEDIVKPIQRRRPVEEHIYETLISPEKNATKQSIDSPEKSSPSVVPCLSTFAPLNNERSPKKLDDTLQNSELPLGKQTRVSLSESDYVYLCFDGNKNIDAYRVPSNIKKIDDFEDNGEYAVPSSTPQKVKKDEVERRLVRDKIDKECRTKDTDLENNYDEGSDVWKRISNDTVIENPALKNRRNKDSLNNINIDDYLEVENGPQSPNMPEIWLKSQKEHFTTPRDKKSGSLPRSFQVNLNEAEENSSQSIAKNKPSVYNKVYLNREGKVLQNDRPFTIASDFSEISYEDIERFIKGDDNSALKFPCDLTISNRSSRSFVEGESIDEALDCRSRSTLELEEEIDRCYKNNFEMRREQLGNLNNASNNNLLLSTQMMDQSISSSMEVMNEKSQNCNSQEDIPTSVHPEHKIYKTTANVLSLKSVLNRFKLKGWSNQEQSAANTEKDNAKDVKKTDAKKTATPKNNSRNLMQRFKSIINDEQHENNVAEALNLTLKDINYEDKDIVKNVERKNSKGEVVRKNSKGDAGRKNSITVLVTQPDDSPDKNNLVQSKSFSETTDQGKMASSISKSCNNITSPYKSTDCLAANVVEMSQSAQFPNMNQGLKSAQSSVQDLNKLPIYKQGSRHLGARIAQSDYADPKALFLGDTASDLDNVNVFINKNALRPDSLLSNSSHFTSSSEGYANTQIEASKNNSFLYRDSSSKSLKLSKDIQTDQITPIKQEGGKILSQKRESSTAESKRFQFKIDSDESFYEKSFDEMENMFGNEIFRDSAIYSDPEDAVTHGTDRKSNTTLTRSVSITKRTSFVSSNIVKSERVDGAKRISGELFKIAPENFVKNEMPIITSTSYLSSVEHVSNPTTDLKRTASIKDKSKEVEKSSLNSSTSSPLKTTPVKPAPPVPVKPQFKPNILQGIKCPTVIKSFETPPLNTTTLDTSKSDVIKPRFSTYNREKHLSASLKITEHDLTEKPATIKIEQHVAELDGPQHEVSGKLNLCIKLPEKPLNVFQFPSPKSPTDKFKPGIPRPNNERTNSSNIQMKRMSFERSSLDSATISRRTKSVASCEADAKNEKLTSVSVQDRKKEIESITLNEQKIKNKMSNRKSADFLTEHSSQTFSRSLSMKMTATNNISIKDQSSVSSSVKNSIPIYKPLVQKCNIPLPHSSSGPKHSSLSFDKVDNTNNLSDSCEAENKVKDVQNSSNVESNNCNENKSEIGEDNSKGGWVKHIVNRFQ